MSKAGFHGSQIIWNGLAQDCAIFKKKGTPPSQGRLSLEVAIFPKYASGYKVFG